MTGNRPTKYNWQYRQKCTVQACSLVGLQSKKAQNPTKCDTARCDRMRHTKSAFVGTQERRKIPSQERGPSDTLAQSCTIEDSSLHFVFPVSSEFQLPGPNQVFPSLFPLVENSNTSVRILLPEWVDFSLSMIIYSHSKSAMELTSADPGVSQHAKVPIEDTNTKKDSPAQNTSDIIQRGIKKQKKKKVESEDESDDGRKKRKLGADGDDAQSRRRLKCPFFLRQPDKYTRGSCRGTGFTDMGKLKDHLKRVHTKARQCPRCWTEFPTEQDLLRHALESGCVQKPKPQDDRIPNEQLQSLNFNRLPYANLPSVEAKWKHLYRQLFPEDSMVPSPYDEYALGPDFDRLLVRSLVKEFHKEFGDEFGTEHATPLQERLLEIIRKCKEVAISSSSDSKNPSPPEQHSPVELDEETRDEVDKGEKGTGNP